MGYEIRTYEANRELCANAAFHKFSLFGFTNGAFGQIRSESLLWKSPKFALPKFSSSSGVCGSCEHAPRSVRRVCQTETNRQRVECKQAHTSNGRGRDDAERFPHSDNEVVV